MALTQRDLESIAETLRSSHPVSLAEFTALKTDVAGLRSDVKSLVEAWRAASFLVAFIKWAAALMAAVAVLWASFTHADFWTKGS